MDDDLNAADIDIEVDQVTFKCCFHLLPNRMKTQMNQWMMSIRILFSPLSRPKARFELMRDLFFYA